MAVSSLHRMFAGLKKLLPIPIWQPVRGIGTAFLTPIWFSLRTGHFKSSLKNKACTRQGAPLPWYTYPAIDFLSQRDYRSKRILEFGGGQSTLWWSSRAEKVLTIEENANWTSYIKSRVPGNVAVHHVPADLATRSIELVQNCLETSLISKFDIVVIDGHLRTELVSLAFEYLAKDGAIILDNSEGYGFFDQIRFRDCRRIDFFGFAAATMMRHCTSIVYVGDCFLLNPDIPIPDIEAIW